MWKLNKPVKIIGVLCAGIAIVFLFGCGYFQDKSKEHYFVKEVITGHCFEVFETKDTIRSEWIACEDVPKGTKTRKVQEWTPEVENED